MRPEFDRKIGDPSFLSPGWLKYPRLPAVIRAAVLVSRVTSVEVDGAGVFEDARCASGAAVSCAWWAHWLLVVGYRRTSVLLDRVLRAFFFAVSQPRGPGPIDNRPYSLLEHHLESLLNSTACLVE